MAELVKIVPIANIEVAGWLLEDVYLDIAKTRAAAIAAAAVAYSGDCDRLFRSNVTAHSGGSALGGFLTPIGHVASTFLPFPGSSMTRITG